MLNCVTILNVATQRVEVEAVNLQAFIEVVQAGNPLQRIFCSGLNANFLCHLTQIRHTICGFRRERDEARTHRQCKRCAVATVDVSAAVELRAVIAGNGVDGHIFQIPLQVQIAAPGCQRLLVDTIGRIVVILEARYQIVGAFLNDVCAEQSSIARHVAAMYIQQCSKVRIFVLQLSAHSIVVVTLEAACTGWLRVVNAVITALCLTRNTHRPVAVDRGINCTFQIERTVVTKADGSITFKTFCRFCGIKLDHAGRGVTTEQRALRAAQNFHLVYVEYREAFQNWVFLNDIVIYQTNRLGCIQIEVGVTQAADVEAWEGAAEVRFNIQAWCTCRQETDVLAGCRVGIQCLAFDRGNRHWHFFDAFCAAVRRHNHGFQLSVIFFCFCFCIISKCHLCRKSCSDCNSDEAAGRLQHQCFGRSRHNHPGSELKISFGLK